MPGAYTHITVVNEAAASNRLLGIEGFPREAVVALGRYLSVAELGAVSPDYAYLDLGDAGSQRWSDLMHFTTTDRVVKAAVSRLRALNPDDRGLPLAWVLGYVAHMTMDVTLHPCINLKVGPYAQNKRGHRVCEMNQDVHAFQRLDLGPVNLAERIKTGIRRCTAGDGGLTADIKEVWEGALREAYPADFAAAPPALDDWHRGFVRSVDSIAEEASWLVPLSRHVLGAELGVSYPRVEDIDYTYIKSFPSPAGPLHFDQLIDRMVENVVDMWTVVARGVVAGDDAYLEHLGNWHLDTGEDQDATGRPLVFWS